MKLVRIAFAVLLGLAWLPSLGHAAVVFSETFTGGTVPGAITSSTTGLAVDTSPSPVLQKFLGRNDGTTPLTRAIAVSVTTPSGCW